MRLIIDTNQANRVPATLPAGFAGLTLSPFLLAEVLLRSRRPRIETLALLSRHDIRISMQPAEMLDLLAPLDANAITELTPFPVPNSELDQLSQRLLNEADYGSAAAWAQRVKASHSKLCGGFVSLSTRGPQRDQAAAHQEAGQLPGRRSNWRRGRIRSSGRS